MPGIHILHESSAPPGRLARRTRRSLEAAGLGESGGITVAESGAWLRHFGKVMLPNGGDFVGVGLGMDAARSRLLRACGGDFSRLRWWHRRPQQLPKVLHLSGKPAAAFSAALQRGGDATDGLRQLLRDANIRIVHLPALDWHFDPRLRAVQAVTTIQIGGAERIALDLAVELERLGTPTLLAALGRPTRESYTPPASFVDLAAAENRMAALHEAAMAFGADLIHAHLVRADEVRELARRGWPVAVTLHNTSNAWPAGTAELGPGDASLLLGCAMAVEREIQLPLPHRTLWNGVATHRHPPVRSGFWRAKWDVSPDALVLLALANIRPQKRIDRLPAVFEAVRAALPERQVHLFLAGSGTVTLTLPPQAHGLGLVTDTAALLADCDALISTSDHEGQSLAQLEALAAGKPVVTTDVGGAREVAGIHLVRPDAPPAAFAAAICQALNGPAPSLPRHFTRHAMASRAAALYPRLCPPPGRPKPRGLWLVCNNFSTGGAQSSARRLLTALAAEGIPVRAAVVEEQRRFPTPGRIALQQAGIPVVATPPPQEMDPADAVRMLLDHIDSSPPAAVIFWNLIASYKILLADALLDVPVYDVSPGEMYFQALERYFVNPRTGLPYLTPRDYGQRLAGVIVKYAAEKEAASRLLGCPAHVIPNGMALPAAAARPAGGGPLIVATAARLSPDKKLEDLLDAFRLALPRLPRCELHIAGGPDGGRTEYAGSLRKRASGLPVSWLGNLDDVSVLLRRADVFAMISEPAGCPNASLEAMAHGLPVLATRHGGADEQIADGTTGFLTPRGDAAAFAEKLAALAADPDLRQRFGAAGRDRIASCFSLDAMTARYRNVLGLG